MIRTLPIMLSLCILAACRNSEGGAGCFLQGGKQISESRQVDSFLHLQVRSMCSIRLHQDSHYAVKLTGPEKLMAGFETRQEDSILIIEDLNSCDWSRAVSIMEIDIYAPAYHFVELTGPCDLRSVDTLHGGRMRFDLLGGIHDVDIILFSENSYLSVSGMSNGHFCFRGYARVATLGNEGSGNMDASQLRTHINYVYQYGVGYTKTWVENELYYSILGPGDIYYTGEPDTIICEGHAGNGQLIGL